MINEGVRFDQDFVNFMKKKKLPYVDLMDAHVEDYAKYKLSVEDYLKQYFIGHYNPKGNFFHAWSLKNKLVEILNPKPKAYPN